MNDPSELEDAIKANKETSILVEEAYGYAKAMFSTKKEKMAYVSGYLASYLHAISVRAPLVEWRKVEEVDAKD